VPVTTPDEIAASTDGEISAATVRRFCRDGLFPGARLMGRSWVIPTSEAAQFLHSYDRYHPGTIQITPALGVVRDPQGTTPEGEQ
jgi:hypothetical protein